MKPYQVYNEDAVAACYSKLNKNEWYLLLLVEDNADVSAAIRDFHAKNLFNEEFITLYETTLAEMFAFLN